MFELLRVTFDLDINRIIVLQYNRVYYLIQNNNMRHNVVFTLAVYNIVFPRTVQPLMIRLCMCQSVYTSHVFAFGPRRRSL